MKHHTNKSTDPLSLGKTLTGVFFTATALAVAGCGGDGSNNGGAGAPPPPSVTVTEVQPENVEVHEDYAGRVRGAREVEVRARVGGILEKRLYNEGEYVTQGDELFQIEEEPSAIALKQAEAELANAQANFNQAEREWNRISELYEQNAVSERERDSALSTLELAEAQVQLAEAGVAEARLNLDYTRVKAPISGPTGLETLSEGSLIERGTLLTTIVQQNPAHVRFSLPERDAALQRAVREAMRNGTGDHQREVRLRLPDDTEYEQSGIVDFTDSTIDPRTGTVSARAIFDNPDGTLVPGQFVRIRMPLQQYEDIFLIEPSAVSEGPEGPRVFVLGDDNTAGARLVQLGPVTHGQQIIRDGLEAGDRLVVEGHVSLQDGMTVTVDNPNGEAQ